MAAQEYLRRIAISGKTIKGFLLALFAGTSIIVFAVEYKLDERIQGIQTAEHQEPLWIASQLQFELLRFKATIGSYALGTTPVAEVAHRFEIAWSRINVLQQGRFPDEFQRDGINDDAVTMLEVAFTRLEPWIATLDRADMTDAERRDIAAVMLQELDGFDLAIKEFLIAISQAKSGNLAKFRGELLSFSNAITYLSVMIFSLLTIFVLLLLMDLRAARNAEREMRKLADEASSAARMKINFMSVVSHELRTPLTAILGGLSLLKIRLGETLKDETSLKLLSVATRNGERLLELVSNILDAQALSEGKVSAVLKPEDINEIVISAVEDCQGYATQFGVSYQVENPEGRLPLLTDRTRLTQVLVNLLSNAAKFTTPGDVVKINVRQVGPKVRVDVIDNGIGIPFDRQGSIFSTFYQVNPGTTGATRSSGLGLSITKNLIDLLGGDIGFTSVAEKGSTFWIELDLLHVD